jgi:hypothetical protein
MRVGRSGGGRGGAVGRDLIKVLKGRGTKEGKAGTNGF